MTDVPEESGYTEIQVASAEIIVEEHVHICVPEPVCHRCFKPWPCSEVEWARTILARGGHAAPADQQFGRFTGSPD